MSEPRTRSQPVLREAIARIIDPELYALRDQKIAADKRGEEWFERLNPDKLAAARAKADAILALSAPKAAILAVPHQSFGVRISDARLPLQYEDGPDYCTVTCANGAAFALTVQPELLKALEHSYGVQSRDEKLPVARPVAFRVPRVVDDKISRTEFRLFDDEDEARRAACDIGADYDGLYLVADRRAAFFAQPDPSLLPSADRGRE
ncbi:MAG: hypothetical protein V4773_11945 [Verrucomicrobiota bacterium]